MAKNVKINGVDYSNVASVKMPLTADPQTFAMFYDTDSGDATAGEILNGKKAWVDGVEVTGTISTKTSTDLVVSGKKVSTPAGYYAALAEKSVADGTATPNATIAGNEIGDTTSSYPITITPKTTVNSAGYINSIADGVAVTKYIQTESKNCTPSGVTQTITPSPNKLLHSVVVASIAVSGNAVEGDVLSGKTFYSNNLTKKTGTLTIPQVSLTTGVLSIL